MIDFDQIAIGLLGIATAWLTNAKRFKYRRYACLLGMAAQPFWFYTAVTHDQPAIALLSGMYFAAWFKGFYQQWLSPLRGAE